MRGTEGSVCREPVHALRERLGVRVDPRHVGQRARIGQEVLLNAQFDLAAHGQVGRAHEVERSSDRAFGGILDRHDRIVGLAALDGAEDLIDRRIRRRVDERAEVLRDRRVAECSRGSQVGNAQLLLERQACRHDFAEYAGHGRVGQRSGVGRHEPREHLGFAFGTIGGAALLQLADGLGVLRARVEAREDLAVERVDRRPMAGEFGLLSFGCGCGHVGSSATLRRPLRPFPRRAPDPPAFHRRPG